jgi:gamma-glutamylcyclotransferase (GGCT)/AIG2-like uncharacterized protein YtfP
MPQPEIPIPPALPLEGRLLFVYGTLMRGQINAHRLRDSTFCGHVKTLPEWDLANLGMFPALVEGMSRVYGELWLVTDETLERIDILEGVPDLYKRIELEVTGMPGGALVVNAYFYPHDIPQDIRLLEPDMNNVVRWR